MHFSVKNGIKDCAKLIRCECFFPTDLCHATVILILFFSLLKGKYYFVHEERYNAKPFLIFSFAQWNDKTEWIYVEVGCWMPMK